MLCKNPEYRVCGGRISHRRDLLGTVMLRGTVYPIRSQVQIIFQIVYERLNRILILLSMRINRKKTKCKVIGVHRNCANIKVDQEEVEHVKTFQEGQYCIYSTCSVAQYGDETWTLGNGSLAALEMWHLLNKE